MSEVLATELGPVFGHERAQATLARAVAAGRLHHGWIFAGPSGIGKARFALQFAGGLLGGASPMDATDPIGRLMVAESHPDFRIVRRPTDDKGKQKSDIPAESIRELTQFFALRPAMGGWRIAIIDSIDELNRFGANALLKTLEEPPDRSLLILIYHGAKPLPATLRSRCQLVRLGAMAEEDVASTLRGAGVADDQLEQVASFAPGRPGRALAYHASGAGPSRDIIRSALRHLGDMDAASLNSALAQSTRSEPGHRLSVDVVLTALERRAARETDAHLAGAWAQTWLDLVRQDAEARELGMERAQALAAALAHLSSAAPGDRSA